MVWTVRLLSYQLGENYCGQIDYIEILVEII